MTKIISQAPSRISLFGGGTDTDPYASQYGGSVLSIAINIRQKLTMYWGDDLYEIPGPNVVPYRGNPNFYYKILGEYNINDMHHTKFSCEYDGLLESGLGSSAAAAVAMLGAINKRLGLGLSLQQIAQKAWELEVGKIGLFGGKQDQYAATFGGVNYLEFSGKGVEVAALDHPFIEPLLPYLVLLYTGYHRQSSVIQDTLKDLSGPQVEALDRIKANTFNAIKAITENNIKEVGILLKQSWEDKKASNPQVTTPEIDEIFKRADKLGAMGYKLLGSGGGGFALFMVEPKNRQKFIDSMKLDYWDFGISWDGLDVRIFK